MKSKNSNRVCPICDGQRSEILHRQEFYLPADHPLAGGYAVVACGDCGFVFADTVVDQSAYDLFYAKRSKYADSRTSTGSGQSGWDAKRLNDTANVIAEQSRGTSDRVLDLGCANGGLLAAFKRLGFSDVIGVDPSQSCVDAARDLYKINAVAASLYALPDLGLFDIITLSHVLEHLEDLHGAVRSFSRLLRPKGIVYVEVPDASRYSEFLFAPFQDFNTEHINHFSHHSLQRLLSSAGLVPFIEEKKMAESAKDVPYPAIYGFYRFGTSKVNSGRDEEFIGRILAYIEESRVMLKEMDNKIAAGIEKNRQIIVWGTGQLTSKLLAKTSLAKADIVSFIDSNPIHHGELWMGKPVLSPQSLVGSTTPILISTTIHQDDIIADIRAMGLPNELITLR